MERKVLVKKSLWDLCFIIIIRKQNIFYLNYATVNTLDHFLLTLAINIEETTYFDIKLTETAKELKWKTGMNLRSNLKIE